MTAGREKQCPLRPPWVALLFNTEEPALPLEPPGQRGQGGGWPGEFSAETGLSLKMRRSWLFPRSAVIVWIVEIHVFLDTRFMDVFFVSSTKLSVP